MYSSFPELKWCANFIALFAVGLLSAEAQNFAPIARASSSAEEFLVGQAVPFSSANSIDPDEGPQPLSFAWDFGDGATSTNPNPIHVYPEPRAYRVTLTVSDGAESAVDSIVVHVLALPTTVPPTRSSLLALNSNETELWVANPDANSVSILSVTNGSFSKIAEVQVGLHPRTLAFSRDGAKVLVACQRANEVWVLNASSRMVEGRVRVGHQPYGVVVSPRDGTILVSNQGDATVTILSPAFAIARIVPVGDTPRALAVTSDGRFAFLTHFLTRGEVGRITEIDLNTLQVSRAIDLVQDTSPDTTSSGRGYPNLLGALTIDPAGRAIWFGGLKANTGRGLFVNGEEPRPENALRGFFGKVILSNAVEEVDRRIDANDTDSVSAIAFSPNGRWAFATHQGAGTLSVYDISAATLIQPGDGNTVSFAARLDLGHAPQGIVVSSNGQRAYVANYLSRNVQVLDVSNPRLPSVLATIAVTDETLSASVANGKRLFYRSREPRHSLANYIACASCHIDGEGHDGRTWDFTNRGEGLRNTTDLRGRGGVAHGPVHWSGNFDEIQDFENDIVRFFGGTGLANDGQAPNPPLGAANAGRSADLDDLAAYVSSLNDPPPSLFRKSDGTLSDAALRGKALFLNPALQCASCHVPPRFTDSSVTTNATNFVRHDVGTLSVGSGKRLGNTLDGLDTPTLLGLWDSGPYLHDGSAATLTDVLTTRNTNDQHGITSTLATNQLSDLVTFLLSLDGSPFDVSTDNDTDGISDPWESLYGLNPADASDALIDSDSDGMRNRDEFLAGTDPENPWSSLLIRQVVRETNEVRFSFPTIAGYTYSVDFSSALENTNWLSVAIGTGDGTEQTIIDTNLPPAKRFYRIRLQP